MFYKIDSSRATLREYWWECRAPWKWPIFLLAVVLKVLRVRLPSSTDDATVESLAPFRVPESDLSADVQERLLPVENQLAELGFHSPVYHVIDDGLHSTLYRFSTLRHESVPAYARIHLRNWKLKHAGREHFFTNFVTQFQDGSFLLTSGGKADVMPPPTCRVRNLVGTDVATLWQTHQAALADELATKAVKPLESQRDMLAAAEAHHAAQRDFHVARGFFQPLSAAEEQKAVEKRQQLGASADFDDLQVLEEIDRKQNSSRSWGRAALILGVSMLLFVSLGATVWDWKFALLLLPILFVHELGHYAAMRIFKYRNLQMFFIPLFGAAVSGRHYNVAGWKKVVVSLMGPLPGIALSVPLAIASWLLEQPILLEGAFLAVVINGLNLLPILPLDGGWVANTLVFSRHYLLSIAFYLVAICLLFLASAAIQDRILMGLGIAMLVGIRWVYQKGKIARDLTKSGFAAVSTDDQTIPQDVALEIIRRVRAASPRGLTPKQTANLTLQVFETLNARPPGWLATIGLFFVYVGSLISALLLAGVLALFQHGDPQAFMAKLGAAASADTPIACGSVERWDGAEAGTLAADANVIVANFPDVAEAKSQFAELQSQLPPAASATLFGQTLLIALPGADNANRERLLGELSAHSQEVFVNNAEFLGWMQLTCVAPNGAVAEEIVAVADEYFRSGDGAFLIPPWSSEFEITPEHRKARQTYLAIVDSAGFYDDKRVEALAEQVQRHAGRRLRWRQAADQGAIRTRQAATGRTAVAHRTGSEVRSARRSSLPQHAEISGRKLGRARR